MKTLYKTFVLYAQVIVPEHDTSGDTVLFVLVLWVVTGVICASLVNIYCKSDFREENILLGERGYIAGAFFGATAIPLTIYYCFVRKRHIIDYYTGNHCVSCKTKGDYELYGIYALKTTKREEFSDTLGNVKTTKTFTDYRVSTLSMPLCNKCMKQRKTPFYFGLIFLCIMQTMIIAYAQSPGVNEGQQPMLIVVSLGMTVIGVWLLYPIWQRAFYTKARLGSMIASSCYNKDGIFRRQGYDYSINSEAYIELAKNTEKVMEEKKATIEAIHRKYGP